MRTLSEWLSWQDTLHFSKIDLGLERVRIVAERLNILKPTFPVITVAGTNGKGSTVAFLHAILTAESYRTGVYTTPHITHYNERIAVAGITASDTEICQAFEKIDQARAEISLTSFEFGTLAAMLYFFEQKVEFAILEVGLGGRLDAVNIWDADLALITTIDIDHTDWLGNDREVIGAEKAGIMRSQHPVICGEFSPPDSIALAAQQCGADLYQYGQDYHYQVDKTAWHWSSSQHSYVDLPLPALCGEYQLQNAALVIAGLLQLSCTTIQTESTATKKFKSFKFQLSQSSIVQGLQNVQLQGRLQTLTNQPEILLDVAHNPQAAAQLARYLQKNKIKAKTRAIFSILCDKDIEAVMLSMRDVIDEWHLIHLDDPRATPVEDLKSKLEELGIKNSFTGYKDFKHIFSCVKSNSAPLDRVIIFGSFLVVSGILSASLN